MGELKARIKKRREGGGKVESRSCKKPKGDSSPKEMEAEECMGHEWGQRSMQQPVWLDKRAKDGAQFILGSTAQLRKCMWGGCRRRGTH